MRERYQRTGVSKSPSGRDKKPWRDRSSIVFQVGELTWWSQLSRVVLVLMDRWHGKEGTALRTSLFDSALEENAVLRTSSV